MRVKYKCCFCDSLYDWHEGLYSNPKYDFAEESKARRDGREYAERSGCLINANSILFACHAPVPDKQSEIMDVEMAGENLENVVINICPDCMRKLLDNCNPSTDNFNAWQY